MKTILRLFVFFIFVCALYAEQIPITITYFMPYGGSHVDSNKIYVMKETSSDLYVMYQAFWYLTNIKGSENALKKDNPIFTHFIFPRPLYTEEIYIPPVFYDTTKLRLKSYTKIDDSHFFSIVDFYILNKNKQYIDSLKIIITNYESIYIHGSNFSRLRDSLKKHIDPTQKTLLRYGRLTPDTWRDTATKQTDWEREGDKFISAQSVSHRWVRDSLGDTFYDPFGHNWDNFNIDFFPLYDCFPGNAFKICAPNGNSDPYGYGMGRRAQFIVHNNNHAPHVRRLSVVGNNGDKRRYKRTLLTFPEDTLEATEKEIKLYKALMCMSPYLPLRQELVFNDFTNVEDNISLIESTVFPNPASRHFTVQGQAFTQIYIYDVLGTLIEKSVIDGTGQWKNNPIIYANGHYTVQLRHSDGTTENLSVIICQ